MEPDSGVAVFVPWPLSGNPCRENSLGYLQRSMPRRIWQTAKATILKDPNTQGPKDPSTLWVFGYLGPWVFEFQNKLSGAKHIPPIPGAVLPSSASERPELTAFVEEFQAPIWQIARP